MEIVMFKYNDKLSFDDNSSHGKILKNIKQGERVLEFGCGNGQLAKVMKEVLGAKVCAVEISEIAMQEAREHLELGIVADAEKLEWVNELGNRKFDVIVCADILEHLRTPEKVLQAALPFLEEDGRVIFSVPNIAHGDIIVKLLENRFDYTSLGLLDDTHIHFFAKENLGDFCESAGLFLTEIDTPIVPMGATEQKNSSVNKDVLAFIQSKEYANAYQFVCVAYKKIYAEQNSFKLIDKSKNGLTGKIYFDTGSGFSEDNIRLVADDDNGLFNFEISLPDNIVAIRFDPTETSGYVMSETEIFVDGTKILPDFIVNVEKYGDDFVFINNDPQLLFEIPRSKKLSFKGRCLPIYSSKSGANNLYNFISNYERHTMNIINEKDKAIEATSEAVKKQAELIYDLSKENDTFKGQVANLSTEIKEKNELIDSQEKELSSLNLEFNDLNQKYDSTNRELEHYKEHYLAAINQREELKVKLAVSEEKYNVISNSQAWKITKPLRVMLDVIKKIIKKIPPLYLMAKGLKCLKQNGFKYTFRKIGEKIHHKKNYATVRRPLYTPEELDLQRKETFNKDIKISILVPLYNTPKTFLCEMIQSVIDQTYSNWELCLADGSDSSHNEVGHIVKKYSHSDERIVYKKLEKNMGISLNTNECIKMATGDYIALFDHDDLLHPAALYEVMHAICDKGADFIYTDENTFHKTPADAYCPHFKPDYAPDTLRTNNYICHFTVFKSSLIDKVGMFRPECDGSQDYDMVLRLTEQAENIVHIPKILYYWRAHAASVATDVSAKPYVIEAAHKALRDHLDRIGLKGTVENTVVPSMYRIKYEIKNEDLVSIVIANKDHIDDLEKCISSIITKTTYKNYEIIVVENNSEEAKTWEYYKKIEAQYGVRVIEWKPPVAEFNYSAINNFGVENSNGKYVILLNNDIEIISPEWIEEMLMFAQRDDIGAVGAKLYYPDNTIQHAGIGIGLLTLAGHFHKNFPKGHPGYMGRLIYAHNVSAVTAACVMISRKVWNEVGGLDESFKVAFNDVDLCMRIRKAGYLIVFTPFAELYHYESKSRGLDSAPEKRERFVGEVTRFQKRWRAELDAGDPYYNPNFSLDKEDFSVR